ncbi:protein serine/threonine kinase [Reticulomyxa filosa]|uniref:Protein serine/threonine kinase n=1 Tax=Reticulomyxa filosa TaxID=46433 RepID=X6PE79_RETFI|nr:protein serine/threonine kinase [Reticulomyxa filosa]|eukprot:ETO36521.1 protein serine/threonine kinase [Reticulomyxa filosa]
MTEFIMILPHTVFVIYQYQSIQNNITFFKVSSFNVCGVDKVIEQSVVRHNVQINVLLVNRIILTFLAAKRSGQDNAYLLEKNVQQLCDTTHERPFGTVYQAKDLANGGTVAVKIMTDEADKKGLEEDIKILKTLKSPYIVTFQDAFIWQGATWVCAMLGVCVHVNKKKFWGGFGSSGGAVADILNITKESLKEEQIQVIMR